MLSTTHLHEFKSADKGQAPVMSLYLPEQKLGSHSTGEGSSNKFILKGRQTGAMHRGHTWVFRAESHDTMMAWYEDIKALTEKTPEERNQFVRHHTRSLSQSSRRSASSDGIVDEDDEEPFSAGSQIDINPGRNQDATARRIQPGGRFPSDIQVNAQRGLQATHSRSSLSSGGQESDARIIAAAGALPGSGIHDGNYGHPQDHHDYGDMEHSHTGDRSNAVIAEQEAQHDGVNPYTSEPMGASQRSYQQDRTAFAPIVAPQTLRSDQTCRSGGGCELNQGDTLVDEYDQSIVTDKSHENGAHREQLMNGGNVNGVVVGGISQQTGKHTHAGAGTQTMTGEKYEPRPTANNIRTDSVNTISKLRMPGRYPSKQ